MLQNTRQHQTDWLTIKKITAVLAALISCILFSMTSFAADPWEVIASARGEHGISKEMAAEYKKELAGTLKEKDGILSRNKYTEYSKAVIVLTSIGENPANFAGYNLLTPLSDFKSVTKQGINGPIWALIAVDSHGYACTERQNYVDEILKNELPAGGWNMEGSGTADPDVTAMALTALSRYQDIPKVKAVSLKAFHVLSRIQEADGGFSSMGTENCESVSQVILCLCANGRDPEEWAFRKNRNTVTENLKTYRNQKGEYMHTLESGKTDAIATQQGKLAEAALWRREQNKTSLFDMTDIP